MPSALVVWGGWDGHEPQSVAELYREILEAEGFDVTVSTTLDSFLDPALTELDLIVPCWTMGEITHEQSQAVTKAVAGGVGMSGCHGGMGDAFRNDTEWQFLVGGQFVAHPGTASTTYRVEMASHPLSRGLEPFDVSSEQYYLHVDPGIDVVATTTFPTEGADGPHVNNPCVMPQVWTKMYGKGRVFYTALGHTRSVLETGTSRELVRRGSLWAAEIDRF